MQNVLLSRASVCLSVCLPRVKNITITTRLTFCRTSVRPMTVSLRLFRKASCASLVCVNGLESVSSASGYCIAMRFWKNSYTYDTSTQRWRQRHTGVHNWYQSTNTLLSHTPVHTETVSIHKHTAITHTGTLSQLTFSRECDNSQQHQNNVDWPSAQMCHQVLPVQRCSWLGCKLQPSPHISPRGVPNKHSGTQQVCQIDNFNNIVRRNVIWQLAEHPLTYAMHSDFSHTSQQRWNAIHQVYRNNAKTTF